MVKQQPFNTTILCAQLRNHISARPAANGWMLLDDRNFAGNTVYLVSRYRDVGVAFHHDEPYHDHLRACQQAAIHAEYNVEVAPAPAGELVVQPLYPSAV